MTEKTANTLIENSKYIRIGWLWVKMKPITLAQIWEAGTILENMDNINFEDKFIPTAKLLSLHEEIKQSINIILIFLFRNNWKRKLFGWYIRKYITSSQFQEIVKFSSESLQAGFFLTCLTFLKGIKEITKPTNTLSQTVHGDLSEQ